MTHSARPGAAAQSTYPVAALERRFTAFAIDRLLGWSLAVGTGVATWFLVDDDPWLVLGIVLAVALALGVVLAVVAGMSGTSPGKAATGLRVVHHGTGTPIGVGRSLMRTLLLGVSGLPTFGIGLATLAWTAVEDRGRQRRGWHDHRAHSVVVDVRPVSIPVESDDSAAPRHIVNLTAMRLVPAPVIEHRSSPALPPAPEHSVPRAPVPATPAPPAPRSAPSASMPPPVPPAAPPASMPSPVPPAAPPAPRPPTVAPSAAAPPVPSTPARRWRVEFDDGRVLDITGVVLVGRRPEPRNGESVAHLVPLSSRDMSVSKTHAQFGPSADGTLLVMDRGSTNGSLLVRRGVTRHLAAGRPSALQPGDKVHFGDRSMTVLGDS